MCFREAQAEANPGTLPFSKGRAQAIAAILAAHAYAMMPLDLDLTDGEVHHILLLRGDELVVYENSSPTQVSILLLLPMAHVGVLKACGPWFLACLQHCCAMCNLGMTSMYL